MEHRRLFAFRIPILEQIRELIKKQGVKPGEAAVSLKVSRSIIRNQSDSVLESRETGKQKTLVSLVLS